MSKHSEKDGNLLLMSVSSCAHESVRDRNTSRKGEQSRTLRHLGSESDMNEERIKTRESQAIQFLSLLFLQT